MPARCAQILSNTMYRPCATAARQVVNKKLLYHLLVDAMYVEAALDRPVSKMRDASKISISSV